MVAEDRYAFRTQATVSRRTARGPGPGGWARLSAIFPRPSLGSPVTLKRFRAASRSVPFPSPPSPGRTPTIWFPQFVDPRGFNEGVRQLVGVRHQGAGREHQAVAAEDSS